MPNTNSDGDTPRARSDNRARYPELAAAIDVARATFGPSVTARKPYVLSAGEAWLTIPTQVWPVKAPRAKSFQRAGGR